MAEIVISLLCGKLATLAMIDNIIIAIDIVMPVGIEYLRMLWINKFLGREVFFSRARANPGKPMQAKLRSVISIGE